MKITKLEKVEVKFPTIVKIGDDHYAVSNPLDINGNLEIASGSRIAINLNDGKWFDWGDDIECLNLEMETFEKGTKFEITI